MEIATLEIILRTDRARRNARRLRTELRGVEKGVNRGRKGLRGYGRDATRATGGALGGFRGLRTAIISVGAALAAVGIGIGFGAIVNTLKDVEFTLAGVKAVTQATDEEFAALSATARELGATTIFTASEAAQGLKLLGLAGFSANESMSAISGTLNLAAAGTLALSDASRITATVVRAFSLEATEAANVADILAVAATNANTTVLGLGDSFSFVGPFARAAGINVADTAAAIGILADAGFEASRAGTGLARVIAGLLKENNELEKALRGTGLSLQDVNIQEVGLQEALRRLKPVITDVASAVAILGQRGGPAFLALTSQLGRLDELTKKTNDAGGAAEDIADILTDTLTGALRLLKSALEEAVLTLGDAGLTAALRSTADTITGVVRALTGDLDPLDEANKRFLDIASNLKALSIVLGVISAAVFINFIPAMVAATISVIAFTASLLLNPLVQLAVIISIAAVALFKLQSQMVTFGDTTFRIGDVVAVLFKRFTDFGKKIALVFQFLGEDASESGKVIESDFGSTIKSVFLTILDLADKVAAGFNVVTALAAGLFDLEELKKIANEKVVTGFFSDIGKEAGERFKASFKGAAKIDKLELDDTKKPTGLFGLEDGLDAVAKAGEDAADVIERLKDEQRLLNAVSIQELEILQNLTAAKAFDGEATPEQIQQIKDLTIANGDLIRQQDLLFEIQDQNRTGLELEAELHADLTRLLNAEVITRDQFNVALGIGRMEIQKLNDALSAQATLARGAAAGLSEFQLGLLEVSTEIGFTSENVRELGRLAATEIGDGLTAALKSPKDAGDILLNTLGKIGDAIIELAAQELILKPLLQTLSGIGSASGGGGSGGTGAGILGAFAGGGGGIGGLIGGLIGAFFSEGGISHKPQKTGFIPASSFANPKHFRHGGTTGDTIPAMLSRDEAVVPLLGGRAIPVEMRDGGGGNTIIFNITTPDVESFRKNQGQLMAQAAAELQRQGSRNG